MTPAAISFPSAAPQRDSKLNVIASEPVTNSKPDESCLTCAFKKPSTPASAIPNQLDRQPVTAEARHIRASTIDSRASSVTLPASRDQRGISITSRTSKVSPQTGVPRLRKRRVEVSVSSDEEDSESSDYAPSEPDSPLADKSARRARNEPVAKKTRTMTSSASTYQHASTKTKNAFGFKVIRPQPRAGSAASNAATKKPSTPAPTASKKPSTPAPRSAPTPAFTHPSKRRAARDAELKTQKIFEDLEEFNTECVIEEADQFEDARLPKDMQRMSITPAPSTPSA